MALHIALLLLVSGMGIGLTLLIAQAERKSFNAFMFIAMAVFGATATLPIWCFYLGSSFQVSDQTATSR